MENQCDRFCETLTGLVFRPALTICAWNLGAVRHVPIPVPLEDRRELMCHGDRSIAPSQRCFRRGRRRLETGVPHVAFGDIVAAPARRQATDAAARVSRDLGGQHPDQQGVDGRGTAYPSAEKVSGSSSRGPGERTADLDVQRPAAIGRTTSLVWMEGGGQVCVPEGEGPSTGSLLTVEVERVGARPGGVVVQSRRIPGVILS